MQTPQIKTNMRLAGHAADDRIILKWILKKQGVMISGHVASVKQKMALGTLCS
jgi:hypothetical protein